MTTAVAANGVNADGVGDTSQLDFLNLMVYDCNCPTNAPMSYAHDSLHYWAARGVPLEKRILGVPFYSTDSDEASLRQKAALAREQAGGVMIWEISTDPGYLLAAIVSELASGTSVGTCSEWSAGTAYSQGDVVSYNGDYYIAEYDNPGYIPDVSTWFWEPTDGAQCNGTGGGSGAGACPDWSQGAWYNAGDIVKFEGAYYLAEHENPGYIPTVITWFWQPNSGSSCTGGSSGGGQASCPGWSEGSWYNAGDTVEYQGQYYVAEHENPGYIPTVSTWFWQPAYSCSGGGTGSSSGGGVSDCGSQWYTARLTNYTSYPDPGSEECVEYKGCTWAGQFYGLPGQQSESWVAENNIIAVHLKDWEWMGMKNVHLRQGSKEIVAKVYDACSDLDCDGCCTNNLGGDGFLIDIESYTMNRFGSGSGEVEFQVCP